MVKAADDPAVAAKTPPPAFSVLDRIRRRDVVLGDGELTASERVAVLGILSHAGDDGRCWPGYRRLQKMFGISPKVVASALRKALGRHVVIVGRRGRRQTPVYQMVPPPGEVRALPCGKRSQAPALPSGRPSASLRAAERFPEGSATLLKEPGEEEPASLPLVADTLENKSPEEAAVTLAEAYMLRALNLPVTATEARIYIAGDLNQGRYTTVDLGRYLDLHYPIACYPRQLAEEVATWLNTINIRLGEQQQMAVWAAWRRRLADVRVGDEASANEPLPADTPAWQVAEVDAEAGHVVLAREWSGEELIPAGEPFRQNYFAAHPKAPERLVEKQVLDDPDVGKPWTFGRMDTPLLAGRRNQANEEAQGG